MFNVQSFRVWLLGSASLAAAGLLQPASAQNADQRINGIEQEIRNLNTELQRVRRELAAKDAAVRAAQADATRAAEQSAATDKAVANLRPPAGFGPGDGRASTSIGFGPSHPNIPSPRSNFTSLNTFANSEQEKRDGLVTSKGTFHIGGVTIQVGGFIEAAGIYRSRNQVADIASNLNTAIPLAQSPLYHEGELRATARQTRVSALAEGDIDNDRHVAAYVEVDFLGAAGTANTNESNSYNPRIRHLYTSYDDDSTGVHFLAGQSWSLATMFRLGVVPRAENAPITIDAQYVPGFTWARQPQLRIAKDFGQKLWIAASLESPQATYQIGPNGTGSNSGTANFNNPGISQLTPGQPYSTDIAPDVILKVAADPGFGHYELYGLGRLFADRVSVLGSGHNNTRLAGGVGGGVLLPVIPKMLDFELSGLAGYGIGRYGSSQLPDATISPTGASQPLPAVHALVGLIGHPVPAVDIYSYVGTEQVGRQSFNTGGRAFGYGNPNYSNAGCDIELSTATCSANSSGIVQGTLGAWWRPIKGDFGTIQTGLQYSYTRRSIFRGTTAVGGGGNNGSDDNMVFASFRYYPFQ